MAPPRAGLVRIVAASLLAAACSDVVAPRPRPPVIGAPEFDVAASGGTAANGTFGESGTALAMGFYPTNPHAGDAIVVTFFWLGSTNIIDSVTDRLANGTRVGNTYTLVEYVTARGLSMATYVATNAQNFPDPNPDQNAVLEVEAHLAGAVTDGGVMLSAYTGVNAVSAQAVGAHRSADGSGSSITVAAPALTGITPGAATVIDEPEPSAERCAPTACADTAFTPVYADNMTPPSVTASARCASTSSPAFWFVG